MSHELTTHTRFFEQPPNHHEHLPSLPTGTPQPIGTSSSEPLLCRGPEVRVINSIQVLQVAWFVKVRSASQLDDDESIPKIDDVEQTVPAKPTGIGRSLTGTNQEATGSCFYAIGNRFRDLLLTCEVSVLVRLFFSTIVQAMKFCWGKFRPLQPNQNHHLNTCQTSGKQIRYYEANFKQNFVLCVDKGIRNRQLMCMSTLNRTGKGAHTEPKAKRRVDLHIM